MTHEKLGGKNRDPTLRSLRSSCSSCHAIRSDGLSSTRSSLAVDDLDRYMKADETATLTGMSVGGLANLRLSGEGPPFCKIGRSVRYRRGTLLDWLQQRERCSTSQ